MHLPTKNVEKRLVNYFMYNYPLVRDTDDFKDLRSNPYVKDIAVYPAYDLKGKQYYVAYIILKDFQALEDLVYMLFRKYIQKNKRKKKKEIGG